MEPSQILSQKALAIPPNVRQSFLLKIPETELHVHLCRLLENMQTGNRCEITHGRDEYGRDIVLRRSSPFGDEYIAIVVKRGDSRGKISGRTTGPVDEMISQANQSIAHPCILKEIEISEIQITGVWVMFFGRLTGNAVRRVQYEAQAVTFKPFPIAWLDEQFTKHYPEIFFAGEVSTYLQDRVTELETQHDLTRRPSNLSDWYVPHSVGISEISASTLSQRLKRALKLRRLAYRDFRAQLNNTKHFILSGAPGLGKSTFLKKIALDFYKEALTKTAELGTNINPGAIPIPILVNANDIVKNRDAQSFLEAHLPPLEVNRSFSVFCLLVDALDEAPEDEQETVLTCCKDIAKHLNCALLVSARPVHAVRTLAQESTHRLPVVHLLPFEFSQAIQLIDRLASDTATATIIKEGISNLQSHMILSPLTISLLLDIAEAEREVPGTIGEIFDQYMDIALGRYDLDRGLEVVFQYYIKKKMLAELAFVEFYEKDRLSIDAGEFDDFVVDYWNSRGLDDSQIERMKADIDRSGVLRFGDDIYFSHRSFLDFFVALYVNDHTNDFGNIEEWLAKVYLNDKWSDIAFHMFAHRREIMPDFLECLVSLEHDNVDYHLRRFLVGRVLQAGWLSPTDVKSRGVEIGASSAPRLFEMISKELDREAPAIMPYGVLMGLSEFSYGSRTLNREVCDFITRLTHDPSEDNLRKSLNLLWAIRTRIPTGDAVAHADRILDLMANLEESDDLSLSDKTFQF